MLLRWWYYEWKTLIFCGFTERSDIHGVCLENSIYREMDCLKMEGLGQFIDLGGRFDKKRGGDVFEGGRLILQCPLWIFCPIGVIENKFTKIKFKYFNESFDYSSWPGWLILSLYAPPHEGLAFLKIMFELVYLFHIVLKSLVSY